MSNFGLKKPFGKKGYNSRVPHAKSPVASQKPYFAVAFVFLAR